jgi:CheY-like chemotaxis protein
VVLVVDDEKEVRLLLVKMLGSKYTVFVASDGQEALDVLAQMPRPAAIILDVAMPHMDGLTLSRRLKGNPRIKTNRQVQMVPILFLTARAGMADVLAGINAGARHYVTKPFSMATLLEHVDAMVGVHA